MHCANQNIHSYEHNIEDTTFKHHVPMQWSKVLQNVIAYLNDCTNFFIISSLKEAWPFISISAFHFNKLGKSFTHGCFVTSLVEIGLAV